MSIVVGYDGSEHARRALERAAEVANGRTVIVVSVVPMAAPSGRAPAALDPDEVTRHREQLDEAVRLLAARGVPAEAYEPLGNPIGDPADALIHVARDRDASLLAVGTRGLGATKRLLLGSVSEKLVREAPCDVLVVR